MGVPGPQGQAQGGCVCRGCHSQPCSRTDHLLRPHPGPIHTEGPVLTPDQTRPHSQTLTPPSTSGQLDLTSAGPPLPCPSASTASPTLWTSGPLLLLWLAASTPACLATRAGAAHHLWPE